MVTPAFVWAKVDWQTKVDWQAKVNQQGFEDYIFSFDWNSIFLGCVGTECYYSTFSTQINNGTQQFVPCRSPCANNKR